MVLYYTVQITIIREYAKRVSLSSRRKNGIKTMQATRMSGLYFKTFVSHHT